MRETFEVESDEKEDAVLGGVFAGGGNSASESGGSTSNTMNRGRWTRKLSEGMTWLNNAPKNLKPLSEFANPSEFSRPSSLREMNERGSVNLSYFAPNYTLVFFASLALSVLTDPKKFFGLLLVGYFWLVMGNPGSSSQPRWLARLSESKRQGLLLTLTLATLFVLGFHTTLLFCLLTSMCFAIIHSVMRRPIRKQHTPLDSEDLDEHADRSLFIGQFKVPL